MVVVRRVRLGGRKENEEMASSSRLSLDRLSFILCAGGRLCGDASRRASTKSATLKRLLGYIRSPGDSKMGANASQLEKELNSDHVLNNEHFYGLINVRFSRFSVHLHVLSSFQFGNTCYCNSVIQALYFCRPFRERILQYKTQLKKSGNQKENLLTCLADLFHNIANQKRRVGTIAPKRFITKLKKENELFDNYMQQDAHEFLNYLLNTISETLSEERRENATRQNGTLKKSTFLHSSNPVSCSNGVDTSPIGPKPSTSASKSEPTWIHEIFMGTLTNETRCLNCETVSCKEEEFLDLSVDVERDASLTHCLREFSATETLRGDQKYHCENCCSKQEAQKRMRIRKAPPMLALHLKRFKYLDNLGRHAKISCRVPFPLELRLFNLSDDASGSDRLYDLVAAVVHCGSTPNRGHYITVVKASSFWLLFDDDIVDKIEPNTIEDFFGLSESGVQKNSESAYILFYQARDFANGSTLLTADAHHNSF
ncbi:hypothetical protein QR680_013569 [Steinernema hermaphroditum]|uniref:ubiquitinyl hydrolase 1 n=1 Tax=Steinernema hermaphroditum TaxID=289476 RepID=A0AA39M2R2_9BILA|nr:hypothetical protein QR680_013569 [Steinernema hermaphroditum]